MTRREAGARAHPALEAFLTFVVSRHRLVVAISLIACLALASGVGGLHVTNDVRAYFSDDNPQLREFEALEAIFDRQDNVTVVVVAHGGDIFTRAGLALLEELTALGWQVPYSRRVDSLANYQHTVARADELVVGNLIDTPADLDDAALERIREIALGEPMLARRLVAPDAAAAVVEIRLALPADSLTANDEVVGWLRAALAPVRERHPDFDLHIGGIAASNVALGEAVQRDLERLVLLSYAVIVLGLVLALRHLAGVAATLLVVTFAVTGTLGAFGWAGTTLESVAGFVPSTVMTIAVADSVHVLSTFYHELRAGHSRHDAIREAMRLNVAPVFFTSVTTAIGVLALNFSDSPPYHDLGNMVAVGVGLALVLSMTLLPALLAWMPASHRDQGVLLERLMSALATWVLARRRGLLRAGVALVALLAAFIPMNQLTERWSEYWDTTFEVRRAKDAVERHFGWGHTIRYRLDSGREQGVADPGYLREVAALTEWLRARPEVAFVGTVTDLLARLNMNLHDDLPAQRRLPERAELAAQYLLVYEMSLPLGRGLEDEIDVARRSTQLSVLLRPSDSESLLAFDREVLAWLDEHAGAVATEGGSSIDMMFAHINHRNIRDLIKGMLIAIGAIALILMLALRSVALGLLSLFTNLAPIGLAYGIWALAVGRIDLAASVVMCMSLGIVVDDTVHFLSKFRRARSARGYSTAAALLYAYQTVGVALLVTSGILVAGFAVLGASHFMPTVTTGTLMALTLTLALLVDFFVLPPLLLAAESFARRRRIRRS